MSADRRGDVKMAQIPTCRCGTRKWRLDAQLRILLHASSDDPQGAFKRELAADSVHELLFWCTGCGDEASPAAAQVMETVWRSHAPERTKDPNEGGILEIVTADPAGPGRAAKPVRQRSRYAIFGGHGGTMRLAGRTYRWGGPLRGGAPGGSRRRHVAVFTRFGLPARLKYSSRTLIPATAPRGNRSD